MLDASKAAKVFSELTAISRTYGKEKIIITGDKYKAEDLKNLSTFMGKYALDDVSMPEKVKELLGKGKRVLMIGDDQKQHMDIYYF